MFSEEAYYALSSISDSLETIQETLSPKSWEIVTTEKNWRTRYNPETSILIEETSSSYNYWVTQKSHLTKNKTEAILLAAQLTLQQREKETE